MTNEEEALALLRRADKREQQKQLIAGVICTPIFGLFAWVLYQIWG